VSEIFRSPFGFHIATLFERRPAGLRSLEEVREQIEETLLAGKRQRALEQFLDRLRARADIQPAKA
jgi:parvulin-like peptidyl-prolyl isomerase